MRLWRNKTSSSTTTFEPKTPRIPKLTLPDEKYVSVPVSFGQSPSEQLPTGLLLRFTPDKRSSTATQDADKSHRRTRTLSTPVQAREPGREVKAPRPIRPHPSQGPYVPADNSLDVYSGIARRPVAVPSAQYLEEQIRKNPPKIMSQYENAEYLRLKRLADKNGVSCNIANSKAYLEVQQEIQEELEARLKDPLAPILKKKDPAAAKKEILDFDEWAGVPVEQGPMDKTTVLAPGQAPKSALKKKGALKLPLKSAMKKTTVDPSKGYQSENETTRRAYDRNGNPIKITEVPSKAYLEEQREREEQEKRHRKSSHAAPPPVIPSSRGFNMPPAATPAPRPHTSIRPALARSSSSSATPSPVERYYIRENVRGFPAVEPPWHDPIYDPRYTELYTGPQRSRIPVTLAWPLIDYDLRKYTSPQPPRLWFDTAFDPMVHPIKIIRSFGIAENMRAIEDAQLNVAENCYVGRMRIKCRYLSQWEIELKAPMGLRIIDVFAAIYKAYNQPLTREEKEAIGPEYLEKCKRSFLQRCEDSPGLTYHEERKGMMRIDLMRGRRLFKGLLPIHGMPDHYELVFDDKVIEQRRR